MTHGPRKGLLLAAIALAIAGCGGKDDNKPTGRSTGSQGQTAANGADRSAGKKSGGSSTSPSASSGGGTGSGAASGGSGSGGSGPPRADRPVSQRTLARYLAKRYRLSEWYGTLKRIRIDGGHVRVYTSLDPASDDDNPPTLACTAVRSYSSRIARVTVYGSTQALVPTKRLMAC